jgi:hypothetical protein
MNSRAPGKIPTSIFTSKTSEKSAEAVAAPGIRSTWKKSASTNCVVGNAPTWSAQSCWQIAAE